VKVGDLVRVSAPPGVPNPPPEDTFIAIITDVCLPSQHMNGLHLVQVLQRGKPMWYPVGYIYPIEEYNENDWDTTSQGEQR
jgi:hypothetical protein